MEITQQVRDYAAAQGLETDQALAKGLEEKAQDFNRVGEIYVKTE
jgi:phosphomethylpyrimidine synthase